MLAVDKDRSPLWVGNNLQKADDLLFLRVPRLHIDMLIGQTCKSDLLAIGIKRTQVDHGFYAQFLEVFHSDSSRLSAPK